MHTPKHPNTLGFIGAGHMAEAIIRGLLRDKNLKASNIKCMDKGSGKAQQLATELGITAVPHLNNLLKGTDQLFLACKPQQLTTLDPQLAQLSKGKCVLSILAGVPFKNLKKIFPQATTLLRLMPNIPCSLGLGMTAYATNTALPTPYQNFLENQLKNLGKVLQVQENQLEHICSISGSGPAYFFEFAHALENAAIHQGLPKQTAKLLVHQTFLGAATLLATSGTSTTKLQKKVTSAGGTTEAALALFQEKKLTATVQTATEAALARGQTLATLTTATLTTATLKRQPPSPPPT